jgi:hypothetical protein
MRSDVLVQQQIDAQSCACVKTLNQTPLCVDIAEADDGAVYRRRRARAAPTFADKPNDYVEDDNAVRVVDAFIDELDLKALRFASVVPAVTGRTAYHPATLLKLYLYGYLNRVQSSRRLEREAKRNVEVMWLTGQLTPDFKTIASMSASSTQRETDWRPNKTPGG